MFYQPAEDSYFLAEIISNYLSKLSKNTKENLSILDMGTGSGIQAENCINNGINKKQIVSVDTNSHALRQADKLGVKTIKSNLFDKIKFKHNLIIFNPPYLPEHKFDKQKDTSGGKKGDETIIRFIKQLKKHLEHEGICFILTSSHTPNKNWIKIAENNSLFVEQVAKKKLFQEELFIWKITLG